MVSNDTRLHRAPGIKANTSEPDAEMETAKTYTVMKAETEATEAPVERSSLTVQKARLRL